MKIKFCAVGATLLAFAFAVATLVVTINAHGEGRAASADGHQIGFAMNATKIAHNEQSAMQGSFTMNAHTADGNLLIRMIRLEAMDQADNSAAFAGPAVLRVQNGRNVHEFRGRVEVLATSNRHRGEAGDPDTVGVNFVPAVQSDPGFSFTGHLTAGDIEVSQLRSY